LLHGLVAFINNVARWFFMHWICDWKLMQVRLPVSLLPGNK